MTDTPRTRAELLSDFADNQNHGITAQKMRNFVVSSPTMGTDEVALSLKNGGSFSSDSNRYSLASGVDQWIPMGVRSDPKGWVVASSYTSPFSGGTVPANSSVLLPAGVFIIGTDIVRSDNSTPYAVSFRFDWVDDPSVDAVYGTAEFYPPSFGLRDNQGAITGEDDYVASGFYRQTQAMHDAGVRIAPKLYQSTGVAKEFNYADLFIVRVA